MANVNDYLRPVPAEPDQTERALLHACMALMNATSRRHALALWSALRSLIEAKFGREEN